MQTCTLAVDIGASSGRHIVGTVQNGKITLQEVYRFENGVHRENGHLCWDIDTLAKEVVNGLKAAHDAGFAPATIGIDTWAVDFVLLDADNKRIGDAVAYRDERTEGIREALEKEYGLTFADHYARTGIQYQPFNTVYQLMALKKEHPEQLAAAKTFLMVPDYLNYLLCGVPANEYTNASTTALVGADSRDWDDALIEKLGLPRGIFQPIKTAGTVLGHLTPDIQKAVGFDAEVILPATHDTGSAFLAVPARDGYAAYLSSGTWSLLGVENAAAITGPDSCAANFTNEGGYEYRYRYLKNIMGLWMIQSVRRELGEKTGTRPSFPELIAAAEKACAEAGVKALVGKIATGDLFVGDSATKAAIEAKCAPDCVEMEGAAVSQIAAKNGVPCVILRAMSDNADEDGHEVLVVKKFSIGEYVATATKIVAAMVESL